MAILGFALRFVPLFIFVRPAGCEFNSLVCERSHEYAGAIRGAQEGEFTPDVLAVAPSTTRMRALASSARSSMSSGRLPDDKVEPPSETDTEADTPTRAIKPPRPRTSKLEGNAARTAVVAVLVAVAVAEVRRLDKIVALVGGFLGIPLAFVYPLAVHLRLVPNAPARTRALSVVAMGVGAVLGLACSAVTVLTCAHFASCR